MVEEILRQISEVVINIIIIKIEADFVTKGGHMIEIKIIIILHITVDCALCALTIFDHAKTFPLIIILSTFTVVSSQIIAPIISMSFNL